MENLWKAMSGTARRELASSRFDGLLCQCGPRSELQRASLELDETDAQRHSEVSGGECPLGDRWYDVSRSIRPRIGASGSSEGESSAVDRGALGPCGQLLSGGRGSESDAATEGWSEAFWFGAMSVTDPAQYRSPDEVVAYFCE